MSDFEIGVVGNPNCGKTTLFNALTGTKQRVGNWPGVTVDRKTGEYTHQGKNIEVVDLPGFYSLSAASLDEEVARDYILSGQADLIVNIIDASNLERNLYLTILLLEMKVPIVVALNMMDMAKDRRIEIDIEELSERLGCPVVPMIASRGKGVSDLKSAINEAAETKTVSELRVMYPVEIQEAVDAIVPKIRNAALDHKMDPVYTAVKLIERDAWVSELIGNEDRAEINKRIDQIEDKLDEETDILVADSRYGLINWLTRETVKKGDRVSRTMSDKIDRVVLNRALGIPIFLAAMYLTFMLTINVGGAFIDFF